MSIRQLNPYIHLNGTAKDAIALYERALGAKTEQLMKYKEAPDSTLGPEHHDRIMHAQLRVGSAVLMVSDAPPQHQMPAVSNVEVCVELSDAAELARVVELLAQGGQMRFPIHDTFWGGKLCMLVDRYTVHWTLVVNPEAR